MMIETKTIREKARGKSKKAKNIL